MKKALFTAVCAFCAIFSAQAVTQLEYNIGALTSPVAFPVAPSVNTLNAGSLTFVGTPNFAAFDGQATTTGWQTAANVGAVNVNGPQMYTFTINPSLATDFSQATITFGASSQLDGNMAVYANNTLIGNDFIGANSAKNVSLSLSSLGTVNGPVQIKIIGWGTVDPGFLGLDQSIVQGQSNLIIDIPAQAPVPEPHEYAMIAGLGLVGFAVYRRRRMAVQA
ncbi:MAG: hypothetical protein LR011_06490 [Verrucomicrobia bacterium]|nr:hypothetical protein [Verrucomicrobiota bacterium]